jgi:sugar phosphate isomerase/epimerase
MSRAEDRSRRQFLRTVAAAGVGVAGGRLARADEAPAKVIVGAHPWVYAAKLPNYDITPELDRIFADMAYAGVDGIELMHNALYPDGAVGRIKRLSEGHHLPVIGTSYSAMMWDAAKRDETLADARRVIERLAAVGGKTLGTSVGSAPRPKTPEQLDAQASVLREISKIAADQGVTVNLHNHTYEVENGQHDLKGTLSRIPDAKLGPDLNWLVRGGVDPAAFLNEHGKQVVFLHLRNQYADGKWSEALDEGDMDYKAIAAALKAIPFTGHAVIELAHERDFTPTRPLRESLRRSRAYVREVLGY